MYTSAGTSSFFYCLHILAQLTHTYIINTVQSLSKCDFVINLSLIDPYIFFIYIHIFHLCKGSPYTFI